ncbi:MAG: hypothetical protein COT71_03865 [Candidatus Andersenbacteria bacterium CG10_big_fil_rev_8_21_14_0_10_54_11]|uniref:Peptidase S11 D-alanyl-D-alanine carboxypeptidase A N-terminal domain-containing protein n=1 Tax=Candidatus Andersenbacteria bacterium CG10_big_fil_rev_8_21_14_0_10_54_11 TaxID=1974485 RepID=A0A2M6WYD7_9BACT|nr:MAG: hypothetical protein COT71_03865 [Candidatus Andersenbacteria bacterium CG10_big_fil_rev_8_21_14_0_10_54_11]
MTLMTAAALAISCLLLQPENGHCLAGGGAIAGMVSQPTPVFTGQALDVELSAAAALSWDTSTGAMLYSKEPDTRRPVASLTKLLSALTVRRHLAPLTMVEIPPSVRRDQRLGANIRLPVGEHVTVEQLLAAGLVASANDAMVTLAEATAGSEEAFVDLVHAEAADLGLTDTRVSNATGLSGGDQYSTARDLQRIFTTVLADPLLRDILGRDGGELVTVEGSRRQYDSTDQLIGTYLHVIAAKTGYTVEAGENLIIVTVGERGQEIGAVVVGSTQRFQDMKVLVEWIWRNYSW